MARNRSRPTRLVSGLLNVAKPAGMTSRRVVDRVLEIVAPAKVGHAGTLDPMATGVLVVCVGSATRLISFVQDQRKSYRAEFVLGQRSDTDDATGNVAEVACDPVSRHQIEGALPQFEGRIQQVPPQFSAVHVEGRRAYALARKGATVELAPRPVEVDRLEIVEFAWPRLVLDIDCGSGTYIRSIGRDLGNVLGCGAVMSALERTRIGPFDLSNAMPFEEISAGTLHERLLPLTAAVPDFPRAVCTSEEAADFRKGRALRREAPEGAADGDLVLCTNDAGTMIALARWDGMGRLHPKVVVPEEAENDE